MANDEGSKNEASGVIKSVSREGRRFPPSKEFAQRALIKDGAAYAKQYRRSIDDSEAFWDETAKAELSLDQAVGQGAHLESPLGALVRRR